MPHLEYPAMDHWNIFRFVWTIWSIEKILPIWIMGSLYLNSCKPRGGVPWWARHALIGNVISCTAMYCQYATHIRCADNRKAWKNFCLQCSRQLLKLQLWRQTSQFPDFLSRNLLFPIANHNQGVRSTVINLNCASSRYCSRQRFALPYVRGSHIL